MPSTFTLRDSSSGRSKETDAAQCSTVVTSRRSRSLVPSASPSSVLLDVAGHRRQAIVSRQPLSGLIVVVGAHERENVAIAALEKARQNLPSHESRGAGEEHGAHLLRLSRAGRG